MSAFEIIFAAFYVSAAIFWTLYLIKEIAKEITKDGEFDWYHVISVIIIFHLALFILAKFGLE